MWLGGSVLTYYGQGPGFKALCRRGGVIVSPLGACCLLSGNPKNVKCYRVYRNLRSYAEDAPCLGCKTLKEQAELQIEVSFLLTTFQGTRLGCYAICWERRVTNSPIQLGPQELQQEHDCHGDNQQAF